jgi:hypothetical protein
MESDRPGSRLERAGRIIAIGGALQALLWGAQWLRQIGHGLGREVPLQLLISVALIANFGYLMFGKNPDRWRWANAAFLSGVWVWRCSFKHDARGILAFSMMAGIAAIGFVVASLQRSAAQRSVAAERAVPGR